MFNTQGYIFAQEALGTHGKGQLDRESEPLANGESNGMSGTFGMKTCSLVAFPVVMVASVKFCISSLMVSLVPLQSFGGLRFCNSMMGAPTLRVRLFLASQLAPSCLRIQ